MKKMPFTLCAALLVAALLLVAGCGGNGKSSSSTETESSTDVETISLDEDVHEGIIGTFEDNGGNGLTITFKKGGSFEGNAWGSEKSGTYEVEEDSDGYNSVVLKFADSSPGESWGVGIGMGKVVAVTSPDVQQYDKVEK